VTRLMPFSSTKSHAAFSKSTFDTAYACATITKQAVRASVLLLVNVWSTERCRLYAPKSVACWL
jgi:hypothetical protein